MHNNVNHSNNKSLSMQQQKQLVSHLDHNCFVNGRLAIDLTNLGMAISKIK